MYEIFLENLYGNECMHARKARNKHTVQQARYPEKQV